MSEQSPVPDDEAEFHIKIDVTLTRAQLRDYLGWAVVQKQPAKADLATIRRLVREAVAVHVVTVADDLGGQWDLYATEEQVSLVDGALERVVQSAKPIPAAS